MLMRLPAVSIIVRVLPGKLRYVYRDLIDTENHPTPFPRKTTLQDTTMWAALLLVIVAVVWIWGEAERRREEAELRAAEKAGLYQQILPVVEPSTPSSATSSGSSLLHTPISPSSPSPLWRRHTRNGSTTVPMTPRVSISPGGVLGGEATAVSTAVDVDAMSANLRGPNLESPVKASVKPFPPPPPPQASSRPQPFLGEDIGFRRRKPKYTRPVISTPLMLITNSVAVSDSYRTDSNKTIHPFSAIATSNHDHSSDWCSHRHRPRRKTWFDPDFKKEWGFKLGEEIEWLDEEAERRRASA